MRRTSANQKKAMGSYRADRDRKRLTFKDEKGIAARPPAYLKKNKLALGEWRAVAPALEEQGILKAPDVSLLASYCILYSRWRAAAADVEERGQVIVVTSQTRTGRTERPAPNPAVRNEVIYQSAMMKAAVKFGLNPLDRPRVEASPFDTPQEDNSEEAEIEADIFVMPEERNE